MLVVRKIPLELIISVLILILLEVGLLVTWELPTELKVFSLNPYSTGSWFAGENEMLYYTIHVLILILLEVGLLAAIISLIVDKQKKS